MMLPMLDEQVKCRKSSVKADALYLYFCDIFYSIIWTWTFLGDCTDFPGI